MIVVNLQTRYASTDGQGDSVTRAVEAEHEDRLNVDLDAAKTGVLTTRVDADDGTVTITAHGYANADVLDLFWTGGKRVGVVVSSVAANTFVISGGTGDDLPIAASTVWASKPVECVQVIDRTKTVALIARASGPWVFRTNDVATPDDVFSFEKNGGFAWSDDGVYGHPLTADVASFFFSNGQAKATSVSLRHLRTA